MKSTLTLLAWALMVSTSVAFQASLVTSVAKTTKSHCGRTYLVEKLPLVSGNWFCPLERRDGNN